MSLAPFYVADSSPLLSYTGEWTSAYTPRGDGFDQTFHQASGSGQTVSFNLTSTGFTVSHATVAPECPLEYSVNGSEFRSTCADQAGLKELDYGMHRVVLRTGNVTVFQLFGIVGSFGGGAKQEQQHVNVTLDDSSSAFNYLPADAWSLLSNDAGLGNYSVALGSGPDAKADLTFKGSEVYLYGRTGPDLGHAQVSLDGQTVAHLNLTNEWQTERVLLYTAGGLNSERDHHLVLTGGKMAIDYAVVSGPRQPKGDAPLAPLIAGVVGGIVVIILLGVIVYLYLMARIKYKVRPALAARSTVESWRKQTPPSSAEADSCSPCEVYPDGGGMVSAQSQPQTPIPASGEKRRSWGSKSGNWPIARLYTRHRGQSFHTITSDGGTSTASYVPYDPPPPVPPLPATASSMGKHSSPGLPSASTIGMYTLPSTSTNVRGKQKEEQSPITPPAIAGLDPSAERWLQENTYAGHGQTQTQTQTRSPSAHSRTHSETSDFEIVTGTHTAQNARRSIARLWPSRDAVPSLYRSNTLNTQGRGEVQEVPLQRSSSSRAGQGQTVPVSASATATLTLDTTTSSFVRPSPAPLTLTSSPSPQPSGYTPSSRNLRRGVSIKSAKTFLTNWVSRPDTPARPQTAARPDSGIFPLTLGLGTVDVALPQSANMFIELDPASPLTASRPPSEWPTARRGS